MPAVRLLDIEIEKKLDVKGTFSCVDLTTTGNLTIQEQLYFKDSATRVKEFNGQMVFFTNNTQRMKIEDTTGDITIDNDLIVTGDVVRSSYVSGELCKTQVWDRTDIGNDILTITTTGYVKIVDVTFQPKVNQSKFIMTCDFNYAIPGNGTDTIDCNISVDGVIMAYKAQFHSVDGARSCSLTPIQGTYRNISIGSKNITVEVRRNSTDDDLLIYRSSGINFTVSEIAN